MKKLLTWIFISPILLFLIWLACIMSKDLREGFVTATHAVFENIRKEIERKI